MPHKTLYKFIYLIVAALAYLAASCASAPDLYPAEVTDALDAINGFYDAVKHKNAEKTYSYLSEIYRTRYSKEEFEAQFIDHYDFYYEFASQLKDSASPEDIRIAAQPIGDPCAEIELVQASDSTWKLSHTPGRQATQTPQMRREALIEALRTRAFLTLIDNYSNLHPELDKQIVRQIKRFLTYEYISPEQVQFYGQEAVISVTDDTQLRMACGKNGWRLTQCILSH
ncbi:MAG: hypothetical protein IKY83_10865 [Proteobacteria bacterium]|nr:hypothetical protein [Pseudomonadota bacterium]